MAESAVKTRIIGAAQERAEEIAAETVFAGGVIVYPTETLYGIGGLALDRGVARRVSDIKRRPPDKPLSVLVKDTEMLSRYFQITEKQTDAIKKILPLPVTVVLNAAEGVQFPPEVSNNGQTAARVSCGEFVGKLFSLLDEPLISSSANISGSANISNGSEAEKIFGGKVELIVDSGNLPPSQGSAIINLTGKKPGVLRRGDIEPEKLSDFLKWLS
ncbi:MAG: L-threonylcarbamoyladenylate synthase [Thermodesulfobacteriota bacterium]